MERCTNCATFGVPFVARDVCIAALRVCVCTLSLAGVVGRLIASALVAGPALDIKGAPLSDTLVSWM